MHLYMTELTVSDFRRAVDWWTHLLAASPALTDEANGFALFEVAGGRLALKRGANPGGGVAHFEVKDLAAELTRMGEAAGTKESTEGYRRAKLSDPDGNTAVLFEWAAPRPSGSTAG